MPGGRSSDAHSMEASSADPSTVDSCVARSAEVASANQYPGRVVSYMSSLTCPPHSGGRTEIEKTVRSEEMSVAAAPLALEAHAPAPDARPRTRANPGTVRSQAQFGT